MRRAIQWVSCESRQAIGPIPHASMSFDFDQQCSELWLWRFGFGAENRGHRDDVKECQQTEKVERQNAVKFSVSFSLFIFGGERRWELRRAVMVFGREVGCWVLLTSPDFAQLAIITLLSMHHWCAQRCFKLGCFQFSLFRFRVIHYTVPNFRRHRFGGSGMIAFAIHHACCFYLSYNQSQTMTICLRTFSL